MKPATSQSSGEFTLDSLPAMYARITTDMNKDFPFDRLVFEAAKQELLSKLRAAHRPREYRFNQKRILGWELGEYQEFFSSDFEVLPVTVFYSLHSWDEDDFLDTPEMPGGELFYVCYPAPTSNTRVHFKGTLPKFNSITAAGELVRDFKPSIQLSIHDGQGKVLIWNDKPHSRVQHLRDLQDSVLPDPSDDLSGEPFGFFFQGVLDRWQNWMRRHVFLRH
jgi:hypothetical protein